MRTQTILSFVLATFWLLAVLQKMVDVCGLLERAIVATDSFWLGHSVVCCLILLEAGLAALLVAHSQARLPHLIAVGLLLALLLGRGALPRAAINLGCGCHPFVGSSDVTAALVLFSVLLLHSTALWIARSQEADTAKLGDVESNT